MPIYDVKCPSCDTIRRDYYAVNYNDIPKCTRCGAKMKRLVSRIHAHVLPNGGIFLEHAGPHGKNFESKKEMRDFEKQTGSIIGMLH